MPEEVFFVGVQEANKVCQLSNKNVQKYEVWVNELGSLSQTQIKQLRSQDEFPVEVVYDEVGNVKEFWVKWKAAEGFIHSGHDDRHYIIDRSEGTISFGNGINGRIPPSQETESIKVLYATGGGENGNLKPYQIDRPAEVLRFVSEVFNPVPAFGGYDRERVHEAVRRGKSLLKHRNRAVTAEDFEALAMEASRNIIKAKCLSNMDMNGKKKAGCVTLVLLQRDYKHDGTYFSYERERVEGYLKDKIPEILKPGRLFVIEPDYIELSVKVWIKVESINRIFEVQREVNEKLAMFLDPITGNYSGKGWDIGNLPNRAQIYTYLKTLKNVMHIDKLFITACRNTENDRKEYGLEELGNIPFAVIVSGKHDVVVDI